MEELPLFPPHELSMVCTSIKPLGTKKPTTATEDQLGPLYKGLPINWIEGFKVLLFGGDKYAEVDCFNIGKSGVYMVNC